MDDEQDTLWRRYVSRNEPSEMAFERVVGEAIDRLKEKNEDLQARLAAVTAERDKQASWPWPMVSGDPYNGLRIKTKEGAELMVCLRDDTFEMCLSAPHGGRWFRADLGDRLEIRPTKWQWVLENPDGRDLGRLGEVVGSAIGQTPSADPLTQALAEADREALNRIATLERRVARLETKADGSP